jgi:antitoxin component YwqK of YwqJK toxin-antitoxin module
MKRLNSFLPFIVCFAFHFTNAQNYSQQTTLCTSSDGQEICWSNLQSYPGIAVSSLENLEMYPAHNSQILKCHCDRVALSGNGKYVFWTNGDSLFKGEIISDKILNVQKIAIGIFYGKILESTFDGSMVLVSIAKRRTKEMCDPVYRALVVFKISGNDYVPLDTFPKPKLCSYTVDEGHLCDDGSVFWKYNYSRYVLSVPSGDHYKTDTLFSTKGYNADIFFISRDSRKIFYSDWYKLSAVDSAKSIYCRDFEGNKIGEPVLISDQVLMSTYGCAMGISPDGKNVCWVQQDKKNNTSSLLENHLYWSNYKDGKWSDPEIVVDRVIYYSTPFTLSNNGICFLGGEYGLSYFYFSDASKLVHPLNIKLDHSDDQNYFNEKLIVGKVKIDSTLEEGEFIKVPFLFHNTDKDSVSIVVKTYYSEPFTIDIRLPNEKKSYSSYLFAAMDSPAETNPNCTTTDYVVASGDSVKIEMWVCFTFSNETKYIGIEKKDYHSQYSYMSCYYFSITSSEVIPEKIQNDYGTNYFSNGKPYEEISHNDDGEIFYKSWYRNGNPKMEISWDENRNNIGVWQLFSETGKLIYKRIYNKRKGNYSTDAWSENGNKIWTQKVKRNCPVKIEKTWYADGALKSRTKWKRTLILNICPFSPFFAFTWASTGSTYETFYENGNKKLKVHWNRRGNERGWQRAWYENGQLHGEEFHGFLLGRLKRHNRAYNPDGSLLFDYYKGDKFHNCVGGCNSAIGPYPRLEYHSREIYPPYRGRDSYDF